MKLCEECNNWFEENYKSEYLCSECRNIKGISECDKGSFTFIYHKSNSGGAIGCENKCNTRLEELLKQHGK
jgi:hypothetical protein